MLKRLLFIFLLFIFVLFFPRDAFAVSVTIANPPSTIGSDPFTLNVTVSGALSGANYLRIDLYKDGSTKYFGETQNGTDWYRDSDGTKYFPITIESGKDWTGSVQGRVGNPGLEEYDGQGIYKLRVRRYTTSGSAGGEDANDNAVIVAITAPTVTLTPAPTSAPTNTPTPTKTPTPAPTNAPTSTPTPTKAVSTSVAQKLTPTPTVDPNSDLKLENSSDPNVFGNESPTPEAGEVLGMATDRTPLLFIALGLIFLVVCGILVYLQFGDRIMLRLRKKS